MSKDSPPTPDYTNLANLQGQQNIDFARIQAALGRPNEYNPYGSRRWEVDPNDPNKFTSISELSPQEQQKYEQGNQLTGGMMNAAIQYGLPSLQKAFEAPSRDAQVGWDPRYGPDQRLQTESGVWELPWAQEKLDFSGAPNMPTPDDAMRQRVEQALYGREAQYLDPQMEKLQNRLDTKLSNQGVFAGSEAYKDSQDVLDEQRRKAYADARMQAIAGGGAEQSNLFGMGLGARQQGVGELTSQGQFANQARSQLVNEMQSEMQNRNAAITGQTNIAGAQQNAVNQGLAAQQQQKAFPVNLINSITQGGQVNNPTYQPFSTPNVEPPPTAQAGQLAYQGALNQTNASNAAKGNAASIAASIAAAALI